MLNSREFFMYSFLFWKFISYLRKRLKKNDIIRMPFHRGSIIIRPFTVVAVVLNTGVHGPTPPGVSRKGDNATGTVRWWHIWKMLSGRWILLRCRKWTMNRNPGIQRKVLNRIEIQIPLPERFCCQPGRNIRFQGRFSPIPCPLRMRVPPRFIICSKFAQLCEIAF